MRKRSSCASGSGYVPSYSTGLAVASTWNGRGRGKGPALDGHLLLLHGLEERMGLGRGAVDLVREQQSGEDRTLPELEVAGPLVEDERARDVTGQQVRRELGALEGQAEGLREAAGGQRLAQPGEVLHEDMASRQHAGRTRRSGSRLPTMARSTSVSTALLRSLTRPRSRLPASGSLGWSSSPLLDSSRIWSSRSGRYRSGGGRVTRKSHSSGA